MSNNRIMFVCLLKGEYSRMKNEILYIFKRNPIRITSNKYVGT